MSVCLSLFPFGGIKLNLQRNKQNSEETWKPSCVCFLCWVTRARPDTSRQELRWCGPAAQAGSPGSMLRDSWGPRWGVSGGTAAGGPGGEATPSMQSCWCGCGTGPCFLGDCGGGHSQRQPLTHSPAFVPLLSLNQQGHLGSFLGFRSLLLPLQRKDFLLEGSWDSIHPTWILAFGQNLTFSWPSCQV